MHMYFLTGQLYGRDIYCCFTCYKEAYEGSLIYNMYTMIIQCNYGVMYVFV